MHGEYLQVGVAFERAREDQVMQRDGGFQRVADDVREVEVVEPVAVCKAVGVDHDQRAKLFRAFPEGRELRCRKFGPMHVGQHLDALEAETHAVVEFLHRLGGVLQRHGAKRRETVGTLCDEGGHAVVDHAAGGHGMVERDRVVALEGRRGDDLKVDAHRIEHGKPVVHIDHGDLAVSILRHVDLAGFQVGMAHHRDVGHHQMGGDIGRCLGHGDMGVDVDRGRGQPLCARGPGAGGRRAVAVHVVAPVGGIDGAVRHLVVLRSHGKWMARRPRAGCRGKKERAARSADRP